jgi:hypothetical protein
MRTGPYLYPCANGMSDVWPLRILSRTSSSDRSRSLPLLFGFIAYAFSMIRTSPDEVKCSLRCIISTIARKPSNISVLQENGTTYRSKNGMTRSRRTPRDSIHQDLGIAGLWIDRAAVEDHLCELKHSTSAFVLVQKELRTSDVAESARRMLLDAHSKRSFTFDEARKEPLGTLWARESFLLIVRTRHVVTIVNVQPDVTSVARDARMSQHIVGFCNSPPGHGYPGLPL